METKDSSIGKSELMGLATAANDAYHARITYAKELVNRTIAALDVAGVLVNDNNAIRTWLNTHH